MSEAHIGPYRLIRKISAGGMGTVYEAMHDAIERRVAIKILHPQHASSVETVTRFFNEAKAANRIDHPGIVQIHDCGQLADGTSYIVMEFLKGETLGKRLRRTRTRRLLSQNLRLLGQVAEALAAAHAAGIIHRDMKPDNVMVIGDPNSSVGERAKILDFGIAKLRVAGGANSVTKDNLLGTPTYMSPEQCRGSSVIEPATDVYALGVMLYRLVAARPPFIALGSGEVLAMHMFNEPPRLKDLVSWVPDELADFIHSLLAKEPSARPPMSTVAQRLAAFSKTYEGFVVPGVTDGDAEKELDAGASQSDQDTGGVNPTLTSGPVETPPSWRDGASLGGRSPSAMSLGGLQKTTQPSIGTVNGQKQAEVPAEKSRGLLSIIAAGIGAVAVSTSIAVWLIRGSAPAHSGAEIGGGKPAAARVHWHITSQPPGAELRRIEDDALLGVTPWEGERDAAVGIEQIRIQAQGFQTQTLSLRRDRDSEHALLLTPNPVSAGTPATAPKPAASQLDATAGGGKTKRPRREPRTDGKSDSTGGSKSKLKDADVLED